MTKLIIIFFFLFSQLVTAEYSEQYDKELYNLVIINPNKALEISQNKLLKAQLSNNIELQLIALLYKSNALDVLSKQEELDNTINQGMNLAKDNNNTRFKSEFTAALAYRLELKGDYLEALNKANQALRYANETNDDRLIAEQLSLRGQIQLAIENFDLALEDIVEASEIFKQNDDHYNLTLNYNIMAIIYNNMSDHDNAIKYYMESELHDAVKSPYNQAALYYNLGSTYFDKKDFDQAVINYEKSSQYSQLNNDSYTLAYTQYGLANVYLEQQQLDQAEAVLKGVNVVFEQNNDILMLYNYNLLLAKIKINKNLFDEANDFIKMAEKQSEILNTPSVKLSLIKIKIDNHVVKGEWQKAFELKNQSEVIKEEVLKKESERSISELKVKYNAQYDQEKMVLLQNQNQLQQTAIIYEKTTKKYLIGLIVLGLIVLLFTYLGYRNQKRIKSHLYHLSTTDYLTGVANRRHIIEKLRKFHLDSINENKPFTLLMIDLDYFKSINDKFGHETGNEVLIYFAKTAKNVMSDFGEIGRIGGEEWVILIESIDMSLIKNKLYELRSVYTEALSIKIPDDCNLSFSSGVIKCTGQHESYEKILSYVDKALYEAKKNGRGQDVFV